jgi:hypothetical protein
MRWRVQNGIHQPTGTVLAARHADARADPFGDAEVAATPENAAAG